MMSTKSMKLKKQIFSSVYLDPLLESFSFIKCSVCFSGLLGTEEWHIMEKLHKLFLCVFLQAK